MIDQHIITTYDNIRLTKYDYMYYMLYVHHKVGNIIKKINNNNFSRGVTYHPVAPPNGRHYVCLHYFKNII